MKLYRMVEEEDAEWNEKVMADVEKSFDYYIVPDVAGVPTWAFTRARDAEAKVAAWDLIEAWMKRMGYNTVEKLRAIGITGHYNFDCKFNEPPLFLVLADALAEAEQE